MQPEIAQANQQVAPVFNQAVQAIQQQTPAIQNLYNTLMASLTNNANAQTQAVNQSAAQRGVAGGELGQNIAGQLGQAATLQNALLGGQRAQAIGANQQLAGQANVARGQAAGDLASTINTQNLEAQKQNLAMTDLERKYQLRQQQYQQEQARAASRAASRASAAAADMDLETFLSNTEAGLIKLSGADGNVSPETFNQARALWVQKGLPESEFFNKYDKYINKTHIQDYTNPLKDPVRISLFNTSGLERR
jgi:hypothetical protein